MMMLLPLLVIDTVGLSLRSEVPCPTGVTHRVASNAKVYNAAVAEADKWLLFR